MGKQKNLRKVLMSGLGIIILALIANIAVFKMNQLKEPVFLEHYIEQPIYVETGFAIYYLTNRDDERKLIDIEFPELDDKDVTIKVGAFGNHYNTLKYYNVNRAQCTIVFHEVDENGNPTFDEDIDLNEATIIFNNGEKVKVSLGSIKLIAHNPDNRSDALDFDFSSSSSDNTSINKCKVLEPITIQNISYNLMDQINDIHNFEVKLSGEKMGVEDITYPLELEKGDSISFLSQFEIEEDMRKYNYYDIVANVNLKNGDGMNEYRYIYNIRYQPYFNDKRVKEFLERALR